MLLDRHAGKLVRDALRRFPAVALIGPRQVGKTTLAKSLSTVYFDLEQETDRIRLDGNWAAVVNERDPVILDEAQCDPRVFPRLRGAIDADRRRNGRFLLLGSISPALMHDVSESLAGRLGICELTPFGLNELPDGIPADRLWLCGGFPDGGLLRPDDYPKWQDSYLFTLAHRDLPVWGLPARPPTTERLFRMLAHAHGQLFNASQFGQSLGLSYHTVQSYTDILIHSFLIRLLPPFHANARKRLIKSPKLYWRDSGLLHALWRVRDLEDLQTRPAMGASWEGWAIEQILTHLQERGVAHDAFFVRTKEGLEADLVLEVGRDRWAIEVKFSSEPSADDLRALEQAAELVDANRLALVCRAPSPVRARRATITPLTEFLTMLVEG